MWYLIASIPDLCTLTYFERNELITELRKNDKILYFYICRENYMKGNTDIYSVNKGYLDDKETTLNKTTVDNMYVNKGFEGQRL